MKTARFWIAVAFLAALSGRCLAQEELSAEKRKDIEYLLEITGATAIGKQMATYAVAQMTQALKKARPDIPQRALDMLPEEIGAVFEARAGSFKEIVIPIYHKYFTGEEIREMIRFYSSDLGRKTIRIMPALINESLTAGQQWGQSLAPLVTERVKARLKREGVEL
jgi:hypothetical protein